MMFLRRGIITALLLVTSAAVADDREVAKEHFRKGTVAYNLGRWLDAAAEYEAAYQALNEPIFLYNIGQCRRLAADNLDSPSLADELSLRLKAHTAYKAYLRELAIGVSVRGQVSSGSEVEKVVAKLESQIVELRGRIARGPLSTMTATSKTEAPATGTAIQTAEKQPSTITVTEQQTPRTPPPVEPRREPEPRATPVRPPLTTPVQPPLTRSVRESSTTISTPPVRISPAKKVAGVVLALVGVAAVVSGGALLGAAKQASDDLTALDRSMGTYDPAKYTSGQTLDFAGGVLLGVGALVAVVGVIVAAVGFAERGPRKAAVASPTATIRNTYLGVNLAF